MKKVWGKSEMETWKVMMKCGESGGRNLGRRLLQPLPKFLVATDGSLGEKFVKSEKPLTPFFIESSPSGNLQRNAASRLQVFVNFHEFIKAEKTCKASV